LAASQAGTFFWHAHVGSLMDSGLVGQLVVRDSETQQPPLYDDDSLPAFIVQDWWRDPLVGGWQEPTLCLGRLKLGHHWDWVATLGAATVSACQTQSDLPLSPCCAGHAESEPGIQQLSGGARSGPRSCICATTCLWPWVIYFMLKHCLCPYLLLQLKS
jgi:hypothetical protein